MRILVVEDEKAFAEPLLEVLREEGYAVDHATDLAAADEAMAVERAYDLVILDWRLPDGEGIALLRRWRGEGNPVPVLMLTGRDAVEDRVDGLDTGADDYLTKPFSFAELLARVRSLLRRRERRPSPLRAGDLEYDPAGRTVTVGGEPVSLTAKELAILEHLLRRRGEVVSRTELEEHAWDEAAEPMSNVVDVLVYRLRRKIDGDRRRRLLETRKGLGWILHDERR